MSIVSRLNWHSHLSTGIFEVDLQHSNIDQLIVSLDGTTDEARIKALMDVLVHAIESHFKYEERRFGDNLKKMTQKHKNEHRRILKEYHDIADKVDYFNVLDIKNEIAGVIRILLINHVKNFDCKYFQNTISASSY